MLFNKLIKYGNIFIMILAVISGLFAILTGKSIIFFILGDEWISGSILLPGFMVYLWAILWFENIKVMAMSEDLHRIAMLGRIFQIAVLAIFMIFSLANYKKWKTKSF